MKITKTLLALTLIQLGVSAQAATVYDKDGTSFDIFGKINVNLVNDAAGAVESSTTAGNHDNTVLSETRLGIAGRTKLTDNVYGIGVSEWQMSDGDHSYSRVRYQYVGVDAQQFGTLTFGKGDSAYFTVAGATDIYDYLDNRTNGYYDLGSDSADTRSGQLMYSLSALGWDFRFSLQTADDKVNNTCYNLNSGWAFAFSTRFSNTVSFAYGMEYLSLSYEKDDASSQNSMTYHFSSNFRNDKTFLNGRKVGHMVNKGLAVSWGTLGDGLYVSFIYAATEYSNFAHHIYDYELVGDYAFDCGLGLKSGIGIKTYKDTAIESNLNLGIYYKFAPNFKVYAEAQIDCDASPEKLYSENYVKNQYLGENKYVLGAEYAF
ncbi:MAG TPA: hypothetical protein DCR21_06335 [Succinivibrionaceae bacterium]|nr:porin [Succinivibrio sp.]HAR80434.1 hypothetical protein [Succinivibrionaceae bacterium]